MTSAINWPKTTIIHSNSGPHQRLFLFMDDANRLTNWLVAALTAGFLAWAGVVWSTGQEILTLVRDVHGDVQTIEAVQIAHERLPWHAGIQSHVVESEKQMSVNQSRLERLERDHAAAGLKNDAR